MNIGDKFGNWTVSGGHETRSGKKTFQKCVCICGVSKMVSRDSLRSGTSTSCGCKKYEANTIHGMWNTKEYVAFQQAKKRCTNSRDKDYSSYGGRGVKFLFSSFLDFISHVGPCPDGYSLGRKDNDGNYEPGNVEWQTGKTQARNKRNTAYIEYQGVKVPRASLVEKSEVKQVTIIARLKRGWSVEEAFGFKEKEKESKR